MNKSELIREIANKVGITLNKATEYFDATIDAITEALANDEKIQISGFGTFEIKTKDAREGINPKTQTKITIPASKTPVFKFGKAYKDKF